VRYSEELKPEDLLHFVYLDEFLDDWQQLYGNDQDELSLWALEILIMSDPFAGDMVKGTGGLRKLRFGSSQAGKRKANRICYAYFPEHHLVLMILAYGKNRQSDLTSAERSGIKEYLEQVQKWLDEGHGHD
jgi:hypothetical protein